MVFLDLLIDKGCRKCLHREDYDFEEREDRGPPSEYWFLGFKDRNVEDEYIEDVILNSKSRFMLGLATSGLIYTVGTFIPDWMFYPFNAAQFGEPEVQEFLAPITGPDPLLSYYMVSCIGFFSFILCAVACFLIYRMKMFESKRVILYLIGSAYVVFLGMRAWNFTAFNSGYFGFFGRASGWLIFLIFYEVAPLISILFMGLPPALTLEIMTLFVSIFIVLVPLVNPYGDLWDVLQQANDERTDEFTCYVSTTYCKKLFEVIAVSPLLIVCIIVVCILIVSFILDYSNRRAFINKKIIQALNKQKEQALVKQKEDQEKLINSIFPPVIARDLIIEQMQESTSRSTEGSLRSLGSSGTLGRTVARLHQNVTIVFTDICGFTAMSQECSPKDVMRFLHSLFVAFDDLIEMDGHLFKVETIGDAFMIASGLNVNSQESVRSFSVGGSTSMISCESMDASSSAKAAIRFAVAALKEAHNLTMPNGKRCQVRAGAHTGAVCSGVVGSQMPRFCLFGDTVNTANRMESTGRAGRLQVSEATHGFVRDEKEFEWEDPVSVKVKGKGDMKTYFLNDIEDSLDCDPPR
ncbi:guanylate cyclase [Chloropicon primus]|nr:guanylate cyclase [Chloropicon primus]